MKTMNVVARLTMGVAVIAGCAGDENDDGKPDVSDVKGGVDGKA